MDRKKQETKRCSKCGKTKPLTEFIRRYDCATPWRAACRDCVREDLRIRNLDAHVKSQTLLRAASKRANRRGMECTITREWIEERINAGVCEATGLPLDMHTPSTLRQRSIFAPSLDRINPRLGYTPDNTIVCCYMYNCCKNTGSDDDVVAMCLQVAAKHLEAEVARRMAK